MATVPDNWPFEDTPNTAVITTRAVLEQGAAVLLVSHDEDDGGWQFLSDGVLRDDDARIVALRTVWTLDPTVGALADLPLGWQAWRNAPGDPWRRGPHG